MDENTITLNLTHHQACQLYDLLEGLNYDEKNFSSILGWSYYTAISCVSDIYFTDMKDIERFRDTIVELLNNVLD